MSIEPTTCPTCGAAAPGLMVTTLGHNTNPLQPIEESLALSIEATAARLAQELADARADLRDAEEEVARLRHDLAAAEAVVAARDALDSEQCGSSSKSS